MAIELKGKVSLVTGAGSGICLAFAKRLLTNGCNVVIADLALQPDAEELLTRYNEGDARAVFIKTDVTDWNQLQAAFDCAADTFGRVDIVCPGAGIFEPPSYMFLEFNNSKDSPSRSTYKTLDVNLTHPIRCTQLAIDAFLRQGHHHDDSGRRGSVVLVSSVAAQTPAACFPLYHASKAAVSHFIRCMAFLEPRHNIRVNGVAPGNVATPIWTTTGRANLLSADKGDTWITAEQIADRMLDLVVSPGYVGGTVLEVAADAVREVRLLNDPGPDLTVAGLTHANLEALPAKVDGMIAENFGR